MVLAVGGHEGTRDFVTRPSDDALFLSLRTPKAMTIRIKDPKRAIISVFEASGDTQNRPVVDT